jgi:hypothetical protein
LVKVLFLKIFKTYKPLIMKRILTLFLALSFLTVSFAAGTATIVVPKKSPAPNANQILVPIGKTGEKVSLMDFSHMKAKDFETLSGKKLNLANKIAFSVLQRKLRNSMNANGDINSKVLEKAMLKTKKAEDKSHNYLRLWLILLGVAIVFSILGVFVPFLWILGSLAGLGAAIFFVLWIIEKAGGV